MSDKPSPYSYRVKSIKKIIDGDTFDCIMDLGFDVLLEARVRMMGIDTPESRTRDLEEKKYGLLSKKFLQEHLKSASRIAIKTYKGDETGKFGRILGDVWCDGVSVNKLMCKKGYAVEYYGQNKNLVEAAHMKNRKKLNKYNSRLSG